VDWGERASEELLSRRPRGPPREAYIALKDHWPVATSTSADAATDYFGDS